jgi:hypothetical protein
MTSSSIPLISHPDHDNMAMTPAVDALHDDDWVIFFLLIEIEIY